MWALAHIKLRVFTKVLEIMYTFSTLINLISGSSHQKTNKQNILLKQFNNNKVITIIIKATVRHY